MEKNEVKLVKLHHVYRIIYIIMTYIEGMFPNPMATPDHRVSLEETIVMHSNIFQEFLSQLISMTEINNSTKNDEPLV